MRSFFKSPLARISFGLTMLTVSLLLISDFVGLMPDSRGNEIELRQHIAESTALQVSMEMGDQDTSKLQRILRSTVDRNERVLGVAIRRNDGTLLADYGRHSALWHLQPSQESTVEQVRVALYDSTGPWGALELVFDKMPMSESMFRGGSSVLKMVLYVALAGFIGYFFFLKKVMRELDPDQVLPDRVRSALDSLADGLMIINHEGVIMFVNQALAKRIGINARKLTGKECSFLDWVANDESDVLPWNVILDGDAKACEKTVYLRTGHHQRFQFIAGASPIMGEHNEVRGVLITLNDVTELEKKHAELEITHKNLQETKAEIEAKNRELFKMATRDPLTNLFNRRAFFDAFDTLFEKSLNHKSRLACIMLDIDLFKSVNDTYGHGVGDEVIQYVANTLRAFQGDLDVIGRFGGEEFCMLMPDATVEAAVQRAEKIRQYIETGDDTRLSVQLHFTSSFGVACMPSKAQTPSELIECADIALYEAKTTGRNRVVSWHGDTGGRPGIDSANTSGRHVVSPDDQQIIDKVLALPADGKPHEVEQPIHVRPAVRHREDDPAAPGALVLVESSRALTQRQLLASNIETAILRAQRDALVLAVVVLDGTALQNIANNVDFNIGTKLCSVLVDRIKNLLRLADVVSQGEMQALSGSVTQTEQNDIAIMLSDIDSKESIPGIVERLLAVFDQRIVLGGLEYVVDTHAGISILGEDGHDADTLLQNACVACSNASASDGRNNYSFYSANMDEAAKRHIRLQSDLYRAIERSELEVYYQPKLDLLSGELVGLEALLRWHHAQLGTIPPDEFIPIAEKTGLIHQLNLWVMTDVVDQIKRWAQSGLRVESVAVNVSAVELKNEHFADNVLHLVEEAGMATSILEVEITESIGIDELEVARDNLEKLHQAGMSISIDDFGTGYSSLGYLQHFPISRLKIDRMFVDGCTSDEKKARVVRSIITMGNSLGMRVLAEGVENREQLLFLRDHHCDEIQGYFISKPATAERTTEYLEEPALLSQRVLAVAVGRRPVESGVAPLPLTGLDAIISRFPDAANEGLRKARQAGESTR